MTLLVARIECDFTRLWAWVGPAGWAPDALEVQADEQWVTPRPTQLALSLVSAR